MARIFLKDMQQCDACQVSRPINLRIAIKGFNLNIPFIVVYPHTLLKWTAAGFTLYYYNHNAHIGPFRL